MKNLDQLLDARLPEMILDLQDLVRLASVKEPGSPGAPFGREIREALDVFLAKGQALGFTVKNVDGYAGHVEFGQGPEILGVLVHLDVVPAGGGWTYPPFAGEVEGNRLYGRGVSDDKGPAVACLHALAALRDAGFTPKRRIRLILGCDEESGWECMEHYFAAEERPLFGFSPDADFPLIMAEKGQLGLTIQRRWHETGGAPVMIASAKGGTRPNVVPDSATATLVVAETARAWTEDNLRRPDEGLAVEGGASGFTLSASGVAAHGSLPEKGVNALTSLFSSLSALAGLLPEEQAAVVRFLGLGIGARYDGGGVGVAFADQISGALTLNLGTLNWDGEGVTCQVDIRYPVTANKDELLAAFAKHAAAAGLEVSVYNHLAPLHVPVDHPLVAKLMRVFREKTGLEAAPLAIGGRTYACAIGTGVAFGPTFPGQPELAHQRDEYVDLDELLLTAKIYAAAIKELAE